MITHRTKHYCSVPHHGCVACGRSPETYPQHRFGEEHLEGKINYGERVVCGKERSLEKNWCFGKNISMKKMKGR